MEYIVYADSFTELLAELATQHDQRAETSEKLYQAFLVGKYKMTKAKVNELLRERAWHASEAEFLRGLKIRPRAEDPFTKEKQIVA
jgi:5-hydroxyisourate hydrolase-like protein (transthyretin family)